MKGYYLKMKIVVNKNADPEVYRDLLNHFHKEFVKDKHHYDKDYKLKPGFIKFAYAIAYNDGLGEVTTEYNDCHIPDYSNEIMAYAGYEIFETKVGIEARTHALACRPAYRGLGIMTKLISKLESLASENNVKVHREMCNPISNALFLKLGWKETGVYRVRKDGERCQIRSEKYYY